MSRIDRPKILGFGTIALLEFGDGGAKPTRSCLCAVGSRLFRAANQAWVANIPEW
jgi:hypothetical protein